jgi:hypothetical protein
MIEAMILAGLSPKTQAVYLRAVWQLAKYYRRAPDQLSEAEVRAHLLDLRQRGVARGTFEIARAALRFFFCQTFGRAWNLFGEKKVALPRQKRLPNWLTEDQVRRLLGGVRSPVPSHLPRRHVCLRGVHQRGHHAGGHRHRPGPPGAAHHRQGQQGTAAAGPQARPGRIDGDDDRCIPPGPFQRHHKLSVKTPETRPVVARLLQHGTVQTDAVHLEEKRGGKQPLRLRVRGNQ